MKHLRLKTINILLPILPMFLTMLVKSVGAREENYKEFEKFFFPTDTIDFNIDGLVIGKISKALALDSKIYVILDDISHSVYVVNILNRSFKVVSVEKQFPGIKLEPYDIALSNDGGFWVCGAVYRYFLFDSKGEFKAKYYTDDLYSSGKTAVDSKGNLIIYSDKFADGIYLYYFDLQRKEKKRLFRIDFPNSLLNSIRRFLGGGLLADDKGNIYVSNAIEDKIYVYDLNGNRKRIFKSKHLGFSMLSQDLPATKEDIMKHFIQRKNKLYFDLFLSMHFLNKKTIVGMFAVKGKLLIELFSTSGYVLNDHKILIPGYIVYSANNYLYLAYQPEQFDSKGYLKNPVLIKYKYRGSTDD
ncbi:MAG: hypothetical protein Q9P90_08695 [candidate division KSB1 bacterium]|nr:hypothetical protein [candidate division KSB1 bacterium]